MNDSRARITVGYDGSESARAALDWAICEATSSGAALDVVVACLPGPAAPWSLPDSEWTAVGLHRAEALGREAAHRVGDRTDVSTEVHLGVPGRVLASCSKHTDLLVVGSAGHVGLGGWVRGSVSRYLLHHCNSPLVVVGPRSHVGAIRRLVLSSTLDLNGETFELVAGWVAARGLPVHVIASYSLPTLLPDLAMTFDADTVRAAVVRENAAYVDRLADRLPAGTIVTTEVVQAPAIEALSRRLKVDDLLIVPRGWEHDVPFAQGCAPVCVV